MPALRYDPALARAGSSFFRRAPRARSANAFGSVDARRATAALDRVRFQMPAQAELNLKTRPGPIRAVSVLETGRLTDSWYGPNRNNPSLVDCFSSL
jgi:hypothetical protein